MEQDWGVIVAALTLMLGVIVAVGGAIWTIGRMNSTIASLKTLLEEQRAWMRDLQGELRVVNSRVQKVETACAAMHPEMVRLRREMEKND